MHTDLEYMRTCTSSVASLISENNTVSRMTFLGGSRSCMYVQSCLRLGYQLLMLPLFSGFRFSQLVMSTYLVEDSYGCGSLNFLRRDYAGCNSSFLPLRTSETRGDMALLRRSFTWCQRSLIPRPSASCDLATWQCDIGLETSSTNRVLCLIMIRLLCTLGRYFIIKLEV